MPADDTRLRRLEDREEIRDLLTSYADCLDRKDFAGYAQLFARDGTLVAQLGEATGPAAIQALLEANLSGTPTAASTRVAFHMLANPVIQVDGDSATSRVLWAYVTHDAEGLPLILQVGHYDDELTREDGSWRFRQRRISRDMGFSPRDRP